MDPASRTAKAASIWRTDLVGHAMTRSKESRVLALLSAWRSVAVIKAREQWREFFEQGRFNARLRTGSGHVLVGTSFAQMIEAQVVGQMTSFISNRGNDFRDAVNSSGLSPDVKHQLHIINRWKAWFTIDAALVMKDGQAISADVRRLGRCIMRNILARHRKPNMRRIGMIIDQRSVHLNRSTKAVEHDWWLRLSTLSKGRPMSIPLVHTDRFEQRQAAGGQRSLSIQINQDRRTKALSFGVMTDCAEAFNASRMAYRPKCEVLALDQGLSTLLATDQGDLLGRNWRKRLEWYDQRITGLAKNLQRKGLKPNRSERYRQRVDALRGWLKSEIGRIMNQLVLTRAPAVIITERLNFQAPGLSKRLNRLISKFGQSVIESKLRDLRDRLGIEHEQVNPAYSSQSCSACLYVDKRNRAKQSVFRCLARGHQRHADGNAALNLRSRRASALADIKRHRLSILDEIVRRFNERHPRPIQRHTGAKGRAADPRLSNRYFSTWKASAMSSAV